MKGDLLSMKEELGILKKVVETFISKGDLGQGQGHAQFSSPTKERQL